MNYGLGIWSGNTINHKELGTLRLNSSYVFPGREEGSTDWESWALEKAMPPAGPRLSLANGEAPVLRPAFPVGVPCPVKSGKIKPNTKGLWH